MMNPNFFSLIGYLSVLLWVAVPVCWFLVRRMRAARWICPLALGLAVMAFLFAKLNSDLHVDRIAPDRQSEVEKHKEMEEAKRKEMEESRSDDVADIRFAEDGSGDFLDMAGMEESDLKYMKSLQEDAGWKGEKKTRGQSEAGDDSLEAKLGGKDAIEGVDAKQFEEKEDKPPILMSEGEMALAHRIDGWNLAASKGAVYLALILLLFDYLARGNVYALAYFPLPLPSAWRNAFHPRPLIVDRGKSPRRPLEQELRWLARQGDCFLLCTDDAQLAESLPESMPRLGKWCGPMEILKSGHPRVTDEFAFEALWFGTCSVVVDSPDRAARLFFRILELLQTRREKRATVRQNAHILWDLDSPPPRLAEFERAAKATGVSLMLCRPSSSPPTSSTP